MTGERHVAIAGGGVAGVEAALALRALAGERLEVTMIAPEAFLTYRPLAVGMPFGRTAAVRAPLAAIASERGFALQEDAVTAVDLATRVLTTASGATVAYDDVVLALGARPIPAIAGALTFRGPRDASAVADALTRIELDGGGRVVFAARTATAWTLPLYELALQTAAWSADRGLDTEITVVTPERAPVEPLGQAASGEIAALLAAAGVRHYAAIPESVGEGGLWVPMEGVIPADVVIALPTLVGPGVAGLPVDELGFVLVDDHCRVLNADGAYAVGDMTARPVRQGGLATQQADVAAACVAAAAGAVVAVEPYAPVLRALLLSGGPERYFRQPPAAGAAGFDSAPWWPPHKIAGRHLAPYLATHAELLERV